MLPFFIAGAGGDADLARAAISELADAYNVASATELELVGRILGFSTVAMDNLRLSMNSEMSDTKALRYRSNAVALSRAAEQCRKILEVVQANRKPAQPPMSIPRPAVVAAPAAEAAQEKPRTPPPPPRLPDPPSGGVPLFPTDLEAMKQGARVMLAAFSKDAGPSGHAAASFPDIPDTAAMIGAAVREAIAASERTAAAWSAEARGRAASVARVGALVAGTDAAFDRGGDQRVQSQFPAHVI